MLSDGGTIPQSERVRVHSGSGSIEHRLPEEFVNYYGIEEGDSIRTTITHDGPEIGFHLRIVAADGEFSNERRLMRTSERHFRVRYPTQVATLLGMENIVATEGSAQLEPATARLIRVSFDPPLSAWEPPAGELGAAPARLSPDVRSLLRIYADDKPLGVGKYRLDLPQDYAQAYRLERGTEIAIRIGLVDGGRALFLDFEGEDDDRALTPRVQRYHQKADVTTDSDRATSGQTGVYLPKQVVHALGIDTGLSSDGNARDHPLPHFEIRPGVGHIVALPIDEGDRGLDDDVY